MATYSPGQRVCLAWAPKNHVAASCANRYIPDHGTKLYMSGPNPTADPANIGALTQRTTLIKDFGTNTAADGYVGFQNCPKFCQNNDKALCTGCFVLPTNLQVGATYSFFWMWAFNSDSDVYSSCWEAKISPSSGVADITEISSVPGTEQISETSPNTETPMTTADQTNVESSQTTQEQPANSSAISLLLIHSIWVSILIFLAE